MLGDDEKYERPRKSLMECMESVFQHREEMPMLEVSRETKESQYFQTNCLFEHVFAGYKDGHVQEVFIKGKEVALSHEDSKE
jgi:hypothetical protein